MAAFDAGTSAAKWRRERRLRSWWRHERMSIAAVLATVSHHSYPKVDTKNDAPRGQKTVTSTRVGFAQSSDGDRPTGAASGLLKPRPQGKVQRHACIGYELAQKIDLPVLHMVEQLPDVLQFFATCLPVPSRLSTCQRSHRTDSVALVGLSASTADGGPVGGSAQDRILCFSTAADSRADHRHSCSSWSRRSWRRGRSSRVTPRTGFNSTYSGADR